MAQIYYYNADGSIKSSVKILKDGRALEVNPSAAAGSKKTWPSMDAWVQEMPREWPRVEAWTAATASATAIASAASAPRPWWDVRSRYVRPCIPRAVIAGPHLAYFLRLPEGATTSTRAAIRDALASYMDFYKWGTCVYRAKRDVKPANPVYYLDDFLVTLTGLDPRGTYTARQILNAVLARQTRAVPAPAAAPVAAPVAPAVAAPVALEETPLDENPEIVKLTAQNAELAWNYVHAMGENKRLKAEIEALQARLCTIRATCG